MEKEHIPQYLRRLRKEAGLTQKDIVSVLGIPKRTWENWEQGSRVPSDWVLKLLESFFKNYEKKLDK